MTNCDCFVSFWVINYVPVNTDNCLPEYTVSIPNTEELLPHVLSVSHSLANLISKFLVTEFRIIHMTGEVKSPCDSLLSFDTMYDSRYTCKILKVRAAFIADKYGEKKVGHLYRWSEPWKGRQDRACSKPMVTVKW